MAGNRSHDSDLTVKNWTGTGQFRLYVMVTHPGHHSVMTYEYNVFLQDFTPNSNDTKSLSLLLKAVSARYLAAFEGQKYIKKWHVWPYPCVDPPPPAYPVCFNQIKIWKYLTEVCDSGPHICCYINTNIKVPGGWDSAPGYWEYLFTNYNRMDELVRTLVHEFGHYNGAPDEYDDRDAWGCCGHSHMSYTWARAVDFCHGEHHNVHEIAGPGPSCGSSEDPAWEHIYDDIGIDTPLNPYRNSRKPDPESYLDNFKDTFGTYKAGWPVGQMVEVIFH